MPSREPGAVDILLCVLVLRALTPQIRSIRELSNLLVYISLILAIELKKNFLNSQIDAAFKILFKSVQIGVERSFSTKAVLNHLVKS